MCVYKGKEIPARACVSAKSNMKRLSPVIKKAWERMDELKDRALELIAKRIWTKK
ncbi:hypothetical protein [Paenibacillus lactis]|uniref:hypothetical protein n=1 Tax=Paenibacillus lactis TaxID=228574 RepID=UPI0016425533